MTELRAEFNNIVRNNFIAEHPYCQYCGSPAEHVHHIIPLIKGGDNRKSNLISLCTECHGKIHGKHFIDAEKKDEWKEAQRIGIEKAKKEGKFKGGQIKKLHKDIYFSLKDSYFKREITKKLFAEKLGVSRPTLDKILKEEEEYIKVMI